MVNVPDLVGRGISVRDAKNQLSSLGLEPGRVAPDSIPSPYPNTITRQDPEPGDSLEEGETVDLWYSTGLGTDTVQVPNVVGQTVQRAQSLLLRRRLRSVVVDPRRAEAPTDALQADTSTSRFVKRQGRAPDTEVRAGMEIRLFTTDDPTAAPDPDTRIRDSSASVD